VGPLARTACGDWTAFDLAAHLVSAERLSVLTFVLRSLAVRGVSGSTASRAAYSAVARPEAVEMVMRCERRHGFETLIDRLHRPSPRLLPRPQVAPVTLFEFWMHHDDLAGPQRAGPCCAGDSCGGDPLAAALSGQAAAGRRPRDRPHKRRQPHVVCRPEIGSRGDPRRPCCRPGAMARGASTAGRNRNGWSGCQSPCVTCLRRSCVTRSETGSDHS
jgi:hypothetical protein